MPSTLILPRVIAWSALLLAAFALSVLVVLDAFPDEAGLVLDIQGWPMPSILAESVRAVTGTEVIIVAGALTALAVWLAQDRFGALGIVLLLVVLLLSQSGIKQVVDRPRPPDVDSRIEARAAYSSPSYPAGHVMGPMVVYGSLLVLLARRRDRGESDWLRAGRAVVAITLAAILLLAGPVNVYLGVHWPTDVLGGYLWGLVLLLPAAAVLTRHRGPVLP